ncbi:hypothetical protein BDN67DRAFT_985976 [Paxillus ammoniavirescens]|nr:hypothetical protein BDN67DRAFT_985976 [Paxillus ammoniavirescens]
MPRAQGNHGEDFTDAMCNVDEPSDTDASQDQESDTEDSDEDEDLWQMRAALAPCTADAMLHDIRKALEVAQNLLFDMCGKYRAALKRNALLEAHAGKGGGGKKGNLTDKDLAMVLQEDTIRILGRKYSVTHCLWMNPEIFPLRKNPAINLTSEEHWLSPMSIEDGINTELFQFVPPADHETMGHKSFAPHFCAGIQCSRSEMVSDIKSCAALITTPNGKYTKLAPILFLDPKNPRLNNFLMTAKLVRALKALLFGKASLSGLPVPSPRTKAKKWELRSTTPGMVAAAAVMVHFSLWRLVNASGDAWSRSVLTFFNNSLFPATSSSPVDETNAPDNIKDDNWEAQLQRASDEHHTHVPEAPMLPATVQAPSVPPITQPRSAPPAVIARPPLTPPAAMIPSISSAMQELMLDRGIPHPPPPPPGSTVSRSQSGPANAAAPDPPPTFDDSEDLYGPGGVVAPISAAKAKPKPKPQRKGKATAAGDEGTTLMEVDGAGSGSAAAARRNPRRANK